MTADELLPLVLDENRGLREQIAAQTKRGDDLERQLRARERGLRGEREQAGAAADLAASQAGAR